VFAERAGQGADDVIRTLADAGFAVQGTNYESFIRSIRP
jgi:hypothetical protein